jgi:hypothetical protein
MPTGLAVTAASAGAAQAFDHTVIGYHARQDVPEQLFLDAAMRAEQHDDARLLLERASGRRPVPLRRRVGYVAAAQALAF